MDHQAFAQLLGNYGEFLGAIAVVVTLGYLAVQIRQNTNGMHAAAYNTWAENLGNVQDSILSDERLGAILNRAWSSEEPLGGLDEETWMAFAIWHQRYFYTVEAHWQMHRLGSLDKNIMELEMDRVRSFLSIPVVRQFWDAGGCQQVSKPLRVEIERQLSKSSNYVWLRWDNEKGFYGRSE